MSDVLIAYYSRRGQNYVSGDIEDLARGNAEILAGFAAERTGGTLFEIDTVKRYPADYNACTDVALEEKNAHARPELKEHLKDSGAYGTVVLVYPNWWGTMPMAVYTFLEENGFAGKTILPLCTHEGSGLSGTESDIARACPESAVGRGLAVKGSRAAASQDVVTAWLDQELQER